MITAVDLILEFWVQIITLMPSTPFIYLFALAIVLIIFNNIMWFVLGK